MGADESKQSSGRQKVSQNEVDRLLREQKELFEKKYAELLLIAKAQNRNNAAAQEMAREEARKEVERVMRQKQQNAQVNHDTSAKATSYVTNSATFERDRSPYTCAGSALTSPTLAPTAPPLQLYPELSSVTPPVYATPVNNATRPPNHMTAKPSGAPTPPARPTPPPVKIGAPPNHTAAQGSRPPPANNVEATPVPSSHGVGGPYVMVNQTNHVPQGILIPLRKYQPAPRERSLSRPRNNPKTSNDDNDIQCVSCKGPYGTYIYQCSKGHSSCQNCKQAFCPCRAFISRRDGGCERVGVCGMPITDMRNITLEAFVCERKVHCPNSDEGCCLHLKLADMNNHIKNCPFGELTCPLSAIFGQCSWKGKLSQIAGHFDNVHQMHRQADVDTEMVLLSLSQDNQIVYLVVIGTYNFLFYAEVSKGDGKLYMAVQLLGSNQSAGKWTYEIHIYNKREPRRKYQYTDVCRPVNKPLKNIITNAECAIIPLAYANTFVNEGSLTYKFYIRKEMGGRNNFGNNQRGRGGARTRGTSSHPN